MARTWKTRLFAATSLDGSIARKNNDIAWLTDPPKNQKPRHIPATVPSAKKTPTFEEHMAEVDFIVMGRGTFDVCRSFEQWPYPREKALLVLSRTLTAVPEGSPVSGRVVGSVEEVRRILDAEGARMVYVDGGETVREFLSRGWVDEMVLTHAPVLLKGDGGGRSLFGDGLDLPEDVRWTLLGVDVIEDGMVTAYYTRSFSE
ncbi:dihydrofolate reductase family protein [Aspergillus lucknowensis]|uniref:2,5-diamino-6-ribosylamino-4(3H)-pyrimidinone 5'-phosphate reductase n=1 Tax=Aspergillus lucknowensis TaxID=176173 RepID=A0ABR4LG49_9EURO